jgi:hypothetical protein
MRSISIGYVLSLIVAMNASTCLAESNAWTGTWHLNETKSQSPGPSFTELVTPQGEYQMNNGRFSYSFRCDGKEYPTARIGASCACKGRLLRLIQFSRFTERS